MEWWTHLWLNEGFATWIEYLCVDHTHPEYEIWTNFLSREYASAMSLDALASSHPIEVCDFISPLPLPLPLSLPPPLPPTSPSYLSHSLLLSLSPLSPSSGARGPTV